MFEPVRGGTRGGQAEFKWTDVSADKDREVRFISQDTCDLRGGMLNLIMGYIELSRSQHQRSYRSLAKEQGRSLVF